MISFKGRDITGETWGSALVVGAGSTIVVKAKNRPNPTRRTLAVFKCECGELFEKATNVAANTLKKTGVLTCRACSVHRATTAKTGRPLGIRVPTEVRRLRTVWAAMRRRCSPSATGNNRLRYYDRGIRVCAKWEVFETFMTDMGIPAPGLEIDRVDNDKGYSKENCRWVSHAENMRNTSRSQVFTLYHPKYGYRTYGCIVEAREDTKALNISEVLSGTREHSGGWRLP